MDKILPIDILVLVISKDHKKESSDIFSKEAYTKEVAKNYISDVQREGMDVGSAFEIDFNNKSVICLK